MTKHFVSVLYLIFGIVVAPAILLTIVLLCVFSKDFREYLFSVGEDHTS